MLEGSPEGDSTTWLESVTDSDDRAAAGLGD
jgi:hypothetical protein